MSEKQRIEFIDLAKGICILLVVLVHVIPVAGEKFEVLGCLRMPLYFCLSGLFYKDYGSKGEFILKKTNKILIPFIAWYLIGYLIYYLGRLLLPSGNDATYNIRDIFFRNEIFNLPIWFLLCLFWSNLLFLILSSFTKKSYYLFIGTLLYAVAGLIISEMGIFNFLYFGSALTCMPFFFLGYFLKRTKILYPGIQKKRVFLIMSLFLIIGLVIAFLPDEIPRLNYYRNEIVHGHPVLIYVSSFSLVAGTLLLCKFINKLPFITWIGRYSIIVLVTHMWLNDVLSVLFSKITGLDRENINLQLFVFLMVMISVSLLIPICKRFLPHITAQKDIIPTDSDKTSDKMLST